MNGGEEICTWRRLIKLLPCQVVSYVSDNFYYGNYKGNLAATTRTVLNLLSYCKAGLDTRDSGNRGISFYPLHKLCPV
jgi:hypothetical protein